MSIVIGDRAVAGKVLGEDNASDGFGEYRDSVLVPQLPPGITIVELTVHTERGDDVRVAEFVEITNIITRPTDEVFADLIADGQLVVVWHYDNATSTWASFDPSAPAEINDLRLVSTNDIVWVETTQATTSRATPTWQVGTCTPWSRDWLNPWERRPGFPAAAPNRLKEHAGRAQPAP